MWVYQQTEPGLWTVGYHKPNGVFESESDHPTSEKAAARVHWLNGGSEEVEPVKVVKIEHPEEVLCHEAEFIAQFNMTIRELRKLVNVWDVGSWSASAKLVKSYPMYLPSFDEFVEDLANMMEE